ncbi:exonuclease domain-containing protein [Sanguibacter suaedae]|uniref:DNA polymerase III subunit epsilon n=1 Tax=Sanguibacter suaedae TaxID=2795737 RepID=A0A934IA13_9MICO|nr:exonuclease domain-containing protein [Sanguibacter suaedae]MBI9114098.1 DNA polymerase III subunit epsilon [Sanguibacter suaedae]
MTWTAGPLLGFDTETTGVDVRNDRIVTAALVRRDAGGTQVRSWLIDPGVDIPEEAAAIHGITTEHARTHGESPGTALDAIADQLAQALNDGVPVVAFNATFDLCILDAELARHGLSSMADRLGRDVSPVIDPLVLDRAVDRYRRGKRKLVDLCGVYGVADTDNLHTADVDVVATLDVLDAMARRHPDLAELELTALHAYQVAEHRRWAESFNSWRERQGLAGPGAGLTWLREHHQVPQPASVD